MTFFPNRLNRLTAFLLFIFAGNLPILSPGGIPLLNHHFSFSLGWFTFFDPVKRLIFLPHYNLAAAFLSLTMVFLWRGMVNKKINEFLKAGIFGFLAGLVLPTTLMVIVLTAGLLFLYYLLVEKKKGIILEIKNLVGYSWPFWLLIGACLGLIKYSLSYFPWSVQSLADAAKRYMGFDYLGVLFGLGTIGILGLLGAFYILLRQKKEGVLPSFWVLSVLLLVALFTVFPASNSYRPLQIDLHLPLAIISVMVINEIRKKFIIHNSFHLRPFDGARGFGGQVFIILISMLLIPSLLVWPVSLKSQLMFIDSKIAAGSPSIPKLPYVVYPDRGVMEAIFWLKDHTDRNDVVLAAETLGSMIPAYAGNFVYLGHGNQTVYFENKLLLMEKLFAGQMTDFEQKDFLKQNRIKYIFFGPEEKELTNGRGERLHWSALQKIFQNSQVTIFQVD